MSHKGFANIAAFRNEVKALAEQFGLDVKSVDIHNATKEGAKRIEIEVVSRIDVDPTEESNAVYWSNN